MFHAPLEYQAENSGSSDFFASWIEEDWYIVPNVHQFIEIAYVRSGTLTLQLNGQELAVPEGHVAFALPYVAHGFSLKTHNRTQYVMHASDYIPSFFQQLGRRHPTVLLMDAREYRPLLDAILAVDPQDVLRVTGLLNLLYAAWLPLCAPQEGADKEQHVHRRVLEYISEHFREDISLVSMAKALGYHEKYLSAVVGRMTNMHFRRFLAMYRISWACEQLSRADEETVPIAALAEAAGFASVSTFNRMFKELRGVSPREFLKGKQ